MRLIGRLFFVILLVFGILSHMDAQTSGKKKYVPPASQTTPADPKEEEEKPNPTTGTKPATKPAPEESKSKFGYGVNLGNIAFAGSAFEFGMSPNIVYKLDEALVIGFMLKLNYFYEKYPQQDLKYSAFDFGPTVFTRWKPLLKIENATPFMQGLFLQAEYERSYPARPVYDSVGNIELNDNGTIKTERIGEDYLYIGIGAASGYPFSTFFSFHYNVIDKIELSRSPFDYRIGFTYNY
jgi:hypothetical protein